MPARNAPISADSPSRLARPTKARHQAMPQTTRVCPFRAAHANGRSSRYFEASTASPSMTAMPRNAIGIFASAEAIPTDSPSPLPSNPCSTVRQRMTARSCKSSTPTAMRPCSVESSPRCSRRRTTTTVLEKTNAAASSITSRVPISASGASAAAITRPTRKVIPICPPPATSVTRPRSRRRSKESSSPTRKSSSTIPRCEISSI